MQIADKYTRVIFIRGYEKPLVSMGEDSTTKHWIYRSSHGYVVTKKKRYTSYEFFLPFRDGETYVSYCSRASEYAISLYEEFEDLDPNISSFIKSLEMESVRYARLSDQQQGI